MRTRGIVGGVLVGIVVLLGAAGAALWFDTGADLWLFERLAAQMTARDRSELLGEDALRVAVCGSSAPLPSPTRAKSCVAVFAGGGFYLVDVGPEAVENLVRWGIPLSQIRGVLLTHFHSDHLGDLGELNLQTWANGRPQPLDVYGGPGVEEIVDGFNLAYRHDQGYRTEHHTERLMAPSTWPLVARPTALARDQEVDHSRTGIVLDDGAVRITAIEVNHEPVTPAIAYRFDYKGRSVVVSGDLKYHAPLADAARGADVLVMEAISRPMTKALSDGAMTAGRERQATIMHDIQDYHIDPAEAATIANDAGVKLLLFYHLLPAPDTFLTRRLFARGIERVRSSGWSIADDGTMTTLPAATTEILVGRIDE